MSRDESIHWRRREFLSTSLLTATGLLVPMRTWSQEAKPTSALKQLSASPLVCETNLPALMQQRITPTEHFFIRCNGNIPKIEAAEHRLRVEGLVEKPLTLSMEDVRRYKKQTVEALLMCAGNRRLEMNAIKKVSGTPWGPGGLGNAMWSGVSLREVLLAAGVKSEAKHVWFEGVDEVQEKDKPPFRFGGSIPLSMVMHENAVPGALLTYEMNEQPLTAEHGAPLRVVVPGVIGARSVKWLSKITLSDRESPNPILQHSYKLVQTTDPAETEKAAPLYTFPVNGFICSPAADAMLAPGKVRLAGYAMATGEANAVVKSVSLQIGARRTIAAKLLGEAKPFAWQLWEAELELPKGQHEIELNITDSLGKQQPEQLPWNYRGYLNNARHRLRLHVG